MDSKCKKCGKTIESSNGYKRQICKYNIPVQLINGLKEGYIHKSLKNQKINCTNVLINK